MPSLAVLADQLTCAIDFARHPLIRRHDFVERVCYFSGNAGLIAWQSNREVAVANGLQDSQQLLEIELRFGRTFGLAVSAPAHSFLGFHSKTPQVESWGATDAGSSLKATSQLR